MKPHITPGGRAYWTPRPASADLDVAIANLAAASEALRTDKVETARTLINANLIDNRNNLAIAVAVLLDKLGAKVVGVEFADADVSPDVPARPVVPTTRETIAATEAVLATGLASHGCDANPHPREDNPNGQDEEDDVLRWDNDHDGLG